MASATCCAKEVPDPSTAPPPFVTMIPSVPASVKFPLVGAGTAADVQSVPFEVRTLALVPGATPLPMNPDPLNVQALCAVFAASFVVAMAAAE